VILYFAARLFERAGADATHAATSLVVGNAVLLVVGTLIAMRFIDRAGWGRRLLLLWGAAAMALCHFGVAVLVGLADSAAEGSSASTALSVLSVACMFLFTLAFSATWGPVVWVVQNEVLPLHVRAQGCALGTAVNWASNSVMCVLHTHRPPLSQYTTFNPPPPPTPIATEERLRLSLSRESARRRFMFLEGFVR
jgi:SP family sugar:H+ symporter-like MFS transporter